MTDHEENRSLPLPPGQEAFVFSSVLKSFVPSLEQIYLGSTTEGQPLMCRAEELCHVVVMGSTGSGKSNLLRLLATQLRAAGVQELWLESMTRSPQHIEECVRAAALELLPQRLVCLERSEPIGKPIVLILDELSCLLRQVPQMAGSLETIGREGRQVGIYLLVASQDGLPKRWCEGCCTTYWMGDERATACAVLGQEGSRVAGEGQGWAWLQCTKAEGVQQVQRVRVPYVDQAALSLLVSPAHDQGRQTWV